MSKHKEITEESQILGLIKNFNLLRIVEKIEERKTVTQKSFNKKSGLVDNISFAKESEREYFQNSTIKKKTKEELIKLANDNKQSEEISNININIDKERIPSMNNINNPNNLNKMIVNNYSNNNNSSNSYNSHININNKKNTKNLTNNNTNLNANDSNNIKFVKLENIDPMQKCKKHELNIIAYVVGTNLLFCEKCIEESPMKVNPLPSVIKDIKKKADSSRVNICFLKHEINRLYEFFESYQEEFEKSNKQKIDDLFSYLYKIISFNYNTAIQILKQCKGEQKIQVDLRINELRELEKELDELTQALDSIQKMNDSNLLEVFNNINDIYERVMNFINYNSELSLLTMKIGLKNKNNIFQMIQDSYFVDVEFANIQGETPTINHILQKRLFWSCFCGELNNPNNQIICVNCSAFRRMETIKNYFSNPENISGDDLKIVYLRRKTESKMFQDYIKETDSLISQGKSFFVVDIEWFLLWKCFVTNDLSEKNLPVSKKKISINKLIGKCYIIISILYYIAILSY